LVTNVTPHAGGFSARSGDISDSQTSALSATLTTSEGNVSFWRKISSEEGYDFLRFTIDGGAALGSWSGELGWAQFSYPVTAGEHTFQWTYSKDGSVSRGSDAAWIDDIEFPTNLPDGVDLLGLTLDVAPDNLKTGGGLATVDFDVRNLGDTPSGGFNVRFFLSDDAVIDPMADTPIALSPSDPAHNPGDPTAYHVAALDSLATLAGFASIIVPAGDPFGTDNQYYVGMVVDADDDVAEADEANNSNLGLGDDVDDVLYADVEIDDFETGRFQSAAVDRLRRRQLDGDDGHAALWRL
jgi:hypothetical protein